MNRNHKIIGLAVLLSVALAPAWVGAGGSDATCNFDRKVEKTADGVRCTFTAKDGTDAAKLQACVKKCGMGDCAGEGVTVTYEATDDGIVIIQTADTEEGIKALHAAADACSTGCSKAEASASCCSKGDKKDCCARACDKA
jgi:hypothetical protein